MFTSIDMALSSFIPIFRYFQCEQLRSVHYVFCNEQINRLIRCWTERWNQGHDNQKINIRNSLSGFCICNHFFLFSQAVFVEVKHQRCVATYFLMFLSFLLAVNLRKPKDFTIKCCEIWHVGQAAFHLLLCQILGFYIKLCSATISSSLR